MNINNKGFTLIEIIAVIAILLIFTVVAVPNFSNRLSKNDDKKIEIVEQSIIDAASTYCDFEDCNDSINLNTLISTNLLDKNELNEIYSNIDDCYVEKEISGEYILKNCDPK